MIRTNGNLEEIAERLRIICTLDFDDNASEMGRQLGINSATVSRALNAEYEKSVIRVATLLISEKGYRRNWIETGEGDRKGKDDPKEPHTSKEKPHNGTGEISHPGVGEIPDSGTSTTPKPVEGGMELRSQAGFVDVPIYEFVDVYLAEQLVATVRFSRIVPGARKRLDITTEALGGRYAPHEPLAHKEGSPADNDE